MGTKEGPEHGKAAGEVETATCAPDHGRGELEHAAGDRKHSEARYAQ